MVKTVFEENFMYKMQKDHYVMPVDANSAFLSWSASYKVNILGEKKICVQFPVLWEVTRKNAMELCLPKVYRRKRYRCRRRKCSNNVIYFDNYNNKFAMHKNVRNVDGFT